MHHRDRSFASAWLVVGVLTAGGALSGCATEPSVPVLGQWGDLTTGTTLRADAGHVEIRWACATLTSGHALTPDSAGQFSFTGRLREVVLGEETTATLRVAGAIEGPVLRFAVVASDRGDFSAPDAVYELQAGVTDVPRAPCPTGAAAAR
jgi:hypothetical protein